MMDINLGEYTLRSDEFNYITGKPYKVTDGKRKGKIDLKRPRYFTTIDNAINDLFQRHIRTADSTTIDEFKTVVTNAKNELSALISKEFGIKYKIVNG